MLLAMGVTHANGTRVPCTTENDNVIVSFGVYVIR